MTLGEKIKKLRKEKNITQEELGNMVGVQKAAINKYETGIVVNLKRSVIDKLAKALDVNPVWLMSDDSDWPPVRADDSATPPKTIEARILAEGVDKLPKEQRERALAAFRILFEPQYAHLFTGGPKEDDNT